MEVYAGGPDISVAQELLDVDEVYAGFQEMRGEAVTEGMDGGRFRDAGFDPGVVEDPLNGPDGQMFAGGASGEEPIFWPVAGVVEAEKFEVDR